MTVKVTPMAVLTIVGLVVLPFAAFAYYVGAVSKKLFIGQKKPVQGDLMVARKPLVGVPYMCDSLGYGRTSRPMALYLPRRLPHLR